MAVAHRNDGRNQLLFGDLGRDRHRESHETASAHGGWAPSCASTALESVKGVLRQNRYPLRKKSAVPAYEAADVFDHQADTLGIDEIEGLKLRADRGSQNLDLRECLARKLCELFGLSMRCGLVIQLP
jgi:hypothetical protein